MSKKQKFTSIVPTSVKRKVFGSFSDLGAALGIKAMEQSKPNAKKCRKCGTAMRQIPGTNVWVCDGMVEQEKNGVKTMVPCGNRTMTAVRSVLQGAASKPKQAGTSAPAQGTQV